MSSSASVENEFDESSITLESFLLIFLAILTGLLAAILLLPVWLPNLATSLMGTSPKVYWYLSRATAFVSLTVLWLSMALGIGISNKMARLWPGAPAAFAIHEYVSILGMAFALFHALVLLGDHYINFTVAQIFMPFATTDYRPTWVGIGQIGFYVWVIVNVSFYIRRAIGQKTWRVLHYLSFAMYVMGLVHGLFSGTDSPSSWAQWYYWLSGGSLLALVAYRIYQSFYKQKPAGAKPASARPEVQRTQPSVPPTLKPAQNQIETSPTVPSAARASTSAPAVEETPQPLPATSPVEVKLPEEVLTKPVLKEQEQPKEEAQPQQQASAPAAQTTAPAAAAPVAALRNLRREPVLSVAWGSAGTNSLRFIRPPWKWRVEALPRPA